MFYLRDNLHARITEVELRNALGGIWPAIATPDAPEYRAAGWVPELRAELGPFQAHDAAAAYYDAALDAVIVPATWAPLEQIAELRRVEARTVYAAAIPTPQEQINLSLMRGAVLAFRAAAMGGLDADEAEEAQRLLDLSSAVSEAREKLEGRLAAIDSALAAGDLEALLA